MAQITIPWTTGTGNIYLTLTSQSGSQVVSVSSDANPDYTNRQQDITFRSEVSPYPTAVLTIIQTAKTGEFDNSFDLSFTINT